MSLLDDQQLADAAPSELRDTLTKVHLRFRAAVEEGVSAATIRWAREHQLDETVGLIDVVVVRQHGGDAHFSATPYFVGGKEAEFVPALVASLETELAELVSWLWESGDVLVSCGRVVVDL